MKTAMQELIEWVNVNDLKLKISLYNNELIDKLKELLEKEKDQIIDASNSAFEDKTTWGERYYNQTYNNGI
jgi:6-phosphogluconate dehydrogenase (decarboxylating)